MLLNKYPYTNFHDMNLDYILKVCHKLNEKINGLKLNPETNTIQLLDSENNVLSEITVPFATNATNATNATKASKDINNKDITSYGADIDGTNDSITLLDGNNHVIRTIPINPTGTVNRIEGYYKTGAKTVFDDDLSVGDTIKILTDYTSSEINDLFDSILAGLVTILVVKDEDNENVKFFSYPICHGGYNHGVYGNLDVYFYVLYSETNDNPPPEEHNFKWRCFEAIQIGSTDIDTNKKSFTLVRRD